MIARWTDMMLRLARQVPGPRTVWRGRLGGGPPSGTVVPPRGPEESLGLCPFCREFVRHAPAGPSGIAPCPSCGRRLGGGVPLVPLAVASRPDG